MNGSLLAGVGISVMIATTSLFVVSPIGAQTKRPAPLASDDAAARPWKRYADWPQRDYSQFNTLAKLASPPVAAEPRKLPGPIEGDPANGEKQVADRTRGGDRLACHGRGPTRKADLPNDVGTYLSEIDNAGREDE